MVDKNLDLKINELVEDISNEIEESKNNLPENEEKFFTKSFMLLMTFGLGVFILDCFMLVFWLSIYFLCGN